MRYENIHEGIFRSRPNRFIAMVEVDGTVEKCHVKNTGRCKELLMDGACVYLEEGKGGERKTKYSLVTVKKGEVLVNIDSQAPNKVVKDWLETSGYFEDIIMIKPEYKYGDSRIDFYLEAMNGTKVRKILIEVKGCTLEEEGVARFPDAPTERGIKHMMELVKAKKEGYEAYIFFVIQMKGIKQFEPNWRTHEAFATCLREAASQGVSILAYDCEVGKDTLRIDQPVSVVL